MNNSRLPWWSYFSRANRCGRRSWDVTTKHALVTFSLDSATREPSWIASDAVVRRRSAVAADTATTASAPRSLRNRPPPPPTTVRRRPPLLKLPCMSDDLPQRLSLSADASQQAKADHRSYKLHAYNPEWTDHGAARPDITVSASRRLLLSMKLSKLKYSVRGQQSIDSLLNQLMFPISSIAFSSYCTVFLRRLHI